MTEGNDRWLSKISSFSSSLKRPTMDVLIGQPVEDHSDICKPTTRIKLCASLPKQGTDLNDPGDTQINKLGKHQLESKDTVPQLVNRCETCSEKTRFSRAVFSCCNNKHLCLRCYDLFSHQQTANSLSCPFCGNSSTSVQREVTGLFSGQVSQGSQASQDDSQVYFPRSINSSEGVSM